MKLKLPYAKHVVPRVGQATPTLMTLCGEKMHVIVQVLRYRWHFTPDKLVTTFSGLRTKVLGVANDEFYAFVKSRCNDDCEGDLSAMPIWYKIDKLNNPPITVISR
jgi:hypothetical protein